jgi:hypothetical protein
LGAAFFGAFFFAFAMAKPYRSLHRGCAHGEITQAAWSGTCIRRTSKKIGSLLTGVGSNVIGFLLGKQIDKHRGPAQVKAGTVPEDKRTLALSRTTAVLGTANLIANIAVLGVTSMLAMEGNKPGRFSLFSRILP